MASIAQHSLRERIIFAILFLPNFSSCVYDHRFFNNRVVVFHNERLNFFDAYETCQSDHMQLLTIQDPIETWFLINRLQKMDILETWLAATDLEKQGVWTWTATGKEISRIPWGESKGNESERCMCVNTDYDGWDETDCYNIWYCRTFARKYRRSTTHQLQFSNSLSMNRNETKHKINLNGVLLHFVGRHKIKH